MLRTLSISFALALAFTAHVGAAEEVVSGQLEYRGKGPLQFTVETTATISVVEVSENGEVLSTVATASQTLKELPSPFDVKVDSKKLEAGRNYRVRVELKQKEKVISSQKENPVAFADGKPAKDVKVVLGLK